MYRDLRGRTFSLADLDPAEQRLIKELRRRAKARPDSGEYHNYWLARVRDFYTARGFRRPAIVKTLAFRVGLDQGSRLMIAAREAEPPDYRSDLEELIRTRFRTRKAFCEATGISEDMLSHVLNGRKHLAIDTLSEALEKIGYKLHIAPLELQAK